MSADLLSGTSNGSPAPSMPSARTFEQNLNPAFAWIVRPNFSSDASGGSANPGGRHDSSVHLGSCGLPFNDGPFGTASAAFAKTHGSVPWASQRRKFA